MGMLKVHARRQLALFSGLVAVLGTNSFSVCAQARGGPAHTAPVAGSSLEADDALVAGSGSMRAGNSSQAVQQFGSVTRLRPQFAEGFLNLGLALEQQGNYPDAAVALDRARTLKPTLRGANLFLGIAEYQTGSFLRAEEALKREIKLNAKDPKALMWLGVAELGNGEVDAAASTLDAAAALAPKDPDILYHRGRAHLLVSKASYQQMFLAEPDSYRVHEVLGQADAEADRTSDAIGEYKLAIERAPHHEGLHEQLGDLLWTAGTMDLADAAYQEELAIDPYSFTTNYKLGSLRVIVGKSQEAVAYLERATKLEPRFESAYYYLGRAQVDLGQDAAGLANLQRASTAEGDSTLNTLAYYQLSRLYRRMHRTDDANAALAKFRTLRDAAEKQQSDKRATAIARHGQLPREERIPTDDGGTEH